MFKRKLDKVFKEFFFIFKNRKLLAQFALVSLILSLPVFYLIYSSYFNFKDSYEFTSLEIKGVAEVSSVIDEFNLVIQKNPPALTIAFQEKLKDFNFYKNTFNLNTTQVNELQGIAKATNAKSRDDIVDTSLLPMARFLANNSKLILDPDIDTYYLMDILVLKSPRIFEALARDSDFISIERLLKQIQLIMSEVKYSYVKVFEQQALKNYDLLTIETCFDSFSTEIQKQLVDNKLFSPTALSKQLRECNKIVEAELLKLLEVRNEKLIRKYNLTMSLTLLIWLIGTLFGFTIYVKIIREKDKINGKIIEHEKRIFESEKLKTLGELASSIVHEVKNPLTLITYEADFMQRLVETSDFNKDVLLSKISKIIKMSQRINKISNMITIYSRNSENDIFEEVSSKEIIEDSIYIINLKAKSTGVTLTLLESPPILFFCRPYQIEQVIINLINNSIDEISKIEEKWIKVSSEVVHLEGTDWLQVSVVDSGKGIAKEYQKKIFDSFFTTKKSGQGTGLGLAVSAKIIEAHNGKLYYDSKSTNTRFVLELPLNLANKNG